jgi:hypothetical protein
MRNGTQSALFLRRQICPRLGRVMPRVPRAALSAFVLYALSLVTAQALVRVWAWDMRGFDANLIDYTWQVELPWRASRGEWSGRDFHFPMGPLWQVFALTGTLAGEFSAPLVIAGMQVATQLTGIAVALWLGLHARGWAKVALVVIVVAASYGAGIATLRPLLSVVHLVLYARAIAGTERPRWSAAWAAATLSSLLMLLSFDRLLFATLSVLAMASFEWTARRRAGMPPGVALQRLFRYALAQAAILAGLSLLAVAVGASPREYLAGQRSLTTSYAVNMATSDGGRPVAGALLFALAAAFVALGPLVARRRQLAGGVLLAGALPLAGFAAVQPNAGHVFMGALPALVALTLIAAADDLAPRWTRAFSGLVALTFLLGWFGSFRGDLWLDPRSLETFRAVATRRLLPQTDFVTDLGRAADFAREARSREPGLACIGFSPALTAAHALADVPGPTSARIRWNAEQRRDLADDIRSVACPYFVYQLGGFDRPDKPHWFLGEDLIAVAERYSFERRLGPATLIMRRRETERLAESRALPVESPRRTVELGEEVLLPLGGPVHDADLLRVEYSVSVPSWAATLGAAPRLEYRLEKEGRPRTEFVDVFDLSVNREAHTLIAVNPATAEARWMGVERQRDERGADAIRLRLSARGRLTPRRADLTVRGVSVWSPGRPAALEVRAACETRADLTELARSGAALSRNVALRPTTERLLLHPNPEHEQGAEVFFRLRPCADACVFVETGIELPPGSGDGAELVINVLDGARRPRIATVVVEPGPGKRELEVPLQPFADRDVLLRFGSLPRADPSRDYLWIQRARVDRCTGRRALAEALAIGLAQSEGNVEPRGLDLMFGQGISRVVHPLTVVPSTCLDLDLGVERGAAEFGYLVAVRVDGLAHGLAMGRVTPEAALELPPISLHDWQKRQVVLELHVEQLSGADGVLRARHPRLARCPR